MPLWTNDNTTSSIKDKVTHFTVGDDHLCNLKLLPYDLKASEIHAEGLHEIGILNDQELSDIKKGLSEILKLWEKDQFTIDVSQEDSHTAIEQYLTDQYGDVGKKIHTARSRNDQVLAMMRLYEKEKIETIFKHTQSLAQQFLDFAKKYEYVPMPGYTHYQKAMPSSLGMWAGTLGEMLYLNLFSLQSSYKKTNLCPLGGGAGFGTTFPLPREKTAHNLGFEGSLIFSLSGQNTRIKIESQILSSFCDVGSTLAHFANDLVIFTAQEFDFFILHDDFCTGSSIMPQKRNLDVCEIMRARYSYLTGNRQTLSQLTHNLISGYHRDLGFEKKAFIESVENIESMLEMAQLILSHLEPNEAKLIQAFSPEMFAADQANELVMQGLPFREAYHQVKKSLDANSRVNPSAPTQEEIVKNLKSKTHLGAPGNLGLDHLEKKLKSIKIS